LLRDHQASALARLELGQRLRQLTRATGQELWIADRIDLALLLDADGLHLGEGSVTATTARRLFGAERPISRAWHRTVVDERDRAELAGVNALLLSPIFAPRKGRAALGAAALGELAAGLQRLETPVRVYALGGVTTAEAAACSALGASGVAAIGAAFGPDTAELLRALGIARR
jgi:thiamine-phosphate pyrophosphorylase